MTQDEIIEMAKQAGAVYSNDHAASLLDDEIIIFAKLVAQHERERIFGELLKIHEKESSRHNYFLHAVVTIRARGDNK